MIGHQFVTAALRANGLPDTLAFAAGLPLIGCPLCPGDGRRYKVADLYEHAGDHTFRDIHTWAHQLEADFRATPTGGFEWECRCSAQGYGLTNLTFARDDHARHDCPACLGCKLDRAVRSL